MNRIKNIFMSIIYTISLQIIFFFHRKIKPPYCTIVAYHSIRDNEIERFKQQMQILKMLTTPIPINYDGPFDRGNRYSIVTFDDAFKCVITNALPVMMELQIPFTIFIPAGCLGKNPHWLENTGDSDEHETISSLKELFELPSEIVTFGSHTFDHSDLGRLDHEKARYEIKGSKIVLESQLKREIDYFAFPYGYYNSKLVECCLEAEYKQTFSLAHESPLTPLKTYVRGRVIARPSDWKIEFMLKILGGYGWKAITGSLRKKIK